jgi:signal transduction histidine kinase
LIDGDVVSLAFWTEEPFVAILLGAPVVRSQLLPALGGTDFQASVVAPGGQMLVGDAAPAEQAVASYTLRSAELPLLLRVWPTDPAALQTQMNRQQNLYLGMLAVLVALLTFGGYFTVRTLRTQLRVTQMQSDFVSTVSHEFRSPLAGINQLGEMLRDGRVPDDRRQHYYEMIVAETQRLRRQVENILSFSRMDDGRKPYRLEPLDPTGWLRDVSAEFQRQVADAGFVIEANIPDALPAIAADRDALTTAVHNLLDNAVKYSRESRLVQMDATANGEGLTIAVRDRGAGIRDADRPRIFEKFYRGDGELTERVKGVGLGLSLVQHIVTAHGGTVDVESQEGTGSTFTIRLKTGTQHA